jgi:hypothetical protein
LDPNEKDFTISKAIVRPKSWDSFVSELKKCILLCCRCHRELHAGDWDLSEIEVTPFVDKKPLSKTQTPTGNCPVCDKDVFFDNIACSKECGAKRASKIEWPNDQEFSVLIRTMNKSAISRKLGVSDAAIRKHMKRRKILG